MDYKGYHIEEEKSGVFEIYRDYDAWVDGEEPEHTASSLSGAEQWIDLVVGEARISLPKPLPSLEWEKKVSLSQPCSDIVFMVDMVYQRAIELDYDLLLERKEDAERRILDLEDMMPQVYGLTKLTTQEERQNLVSLLGEVKKSLREGDMVNASYHSDRFGAIFRGVLWNIIVRCESK